MLTTVLPTLGIVFFREILGLTAKHIKDNSNKKITMCDQQLIEIVNVALLKINKTGPTTGKLLISDPFCPQRFTCIADKYNETI